MFLLNLTLAQFAGLLGGLSAFVVALYLLDRSRRRQVVSTLRFWTASDQATEIKRRRRIQQPWSLVLQLLSLALLLLALAQLRLGSQAPQPRDHVLILDTSAWMAARNSKGALIEQARNSARAYVQALPAGDRLMLVRADALATPATGFESNRQALDDSIAASLPGATALNLQQAFEFARQAQKLKGGRPGEVVYAGPGRMSDSAKPQDAANLRVLRVPESIENCGIRQIGLRRSGNDAGVWEVLVAVKNYGRNPRTVPLGVQFAGTLVGTRRFTLPPGAEQSASFPLRTRAPGVIESRLLEPDAFPEDDRAVLEIPRLRRLRVVVYSSEPDLLRAVLAANPRVEAVFRAPGEYQPAGADIIICDGFRPPSPPAVDSILIEPPAGDSPIPVLATINNTVLSRWRSDHPLAEGLRATDLKLESAEVFVAATDDVRVAEIAEGPVILARGSKPKVVALGFHPVRSALRYELATPLIFANILRWMSPEIFRRWELNGGSVGTVNIALGAGTDPASVRVIDDSGSPLPFTVDGRSVRFFAPSRGTVRVTAGDDEIVYSLMLPEVADATWEPPKGVKRGVPPPAPQTTSHSELWQWLAMLGAAGLCAEWLLFGRARRKAKQLGFPAGRSLRKAVGR